MIIVQLSGGLGNQLFQYAFGRSLSHDLDKELYLDISHYDWKKQRNIKHVIYGLQAYDIKGIVGFYPYSSELKAENFSYYDERSFRKITSFPSDSFRNNLVKLNFPAYFKDFWNSKLCLDNKRYITEKYFVHNQDIIRKDLKLTSKVSKSNQEIIDDMENYDSVAVHFRRGEYKNFSEFGTCSVDYYKEAISKITSNLKHPKLYVFTEDHEWVDNHLKFNIPVQHVVYNEDLNHVARGYAELLNVMSSCDHFVIANSTFSWWGAWLSENKDKQIYYPKPWFQSHRILGIDSINDIEQNLHGITNNYSTFFDNSKERPIFNLTGENFVEKIKEVFNVDLYKNDENKMVIETKDVNSKIIFEDIIKSNKNSAVIIKFNITSNKDGKMFFKFFKDGFTEYTDENSLVYYYHKGIPFDQYIILPNTVSLSKLELLPSEKYGTKITINSFEIKEIENINNYFAP